MLRPKLLIPLLLLAAYLFLEAAYLAGKRLAPDYPDIRKAEIGDPAAVAKGRTTYQFYPLDVPKKGKAFVTFYGELKGNAEKLPKMNFELLTEEEKDALFSDDASFAHFNKAFAKSTQIEHTAFKRRRFCRLSRIVPRPGRYYLGVSFVAPTTLKGERLFFFSTNIVEKIKSFWPYGLLFVRNFVIACIVFFFAFALFLRVGKFWRFAVAFLSCGVIAFIAAATPANVFYSAIGGPKGRDLVLKEVMKEVRQGGEVVKIPVEECAPFAAAFVKVKGRALDPEDHALVYTDLYKAPSYDDSSTENLMTFFGKGSEALEYVFDTAHCFVKDISLRFWHEGRGGAALIESVRLTEAKLPSGLMKGLLSAAQFFWPCFLAFWFSLFLTACFCEVYFKRNFYSKLAAFILAVVALTILMTPIYTFGFREPMRQTTDTRFLLGLRPLSFYALIWSNEPKPDILPEELEAPMSGSMTVASFNDHVLGARADIYPDGRDTFLRFFTREFSNIRINLQRELVVLKGLRLVRLNSAYLVLRLFAWLWLFALILGSLYRALALVFRRSEA